MQVGAGTQMFFYRIHMFDCINGVTFVGVGTVVAFVGVSVRRAVGDVGEVVVLSRSTYILSRLGS